MEGGGRLVGRLDDGQTYSIVRKRLIQLFSYKMFVQDYDILLVTLSM